MQRLNDYDYVYMLYNVLGLVTRRRWRCQRRKYFVLVL